jgi:hypothetical protein
MDPPLDMILQLPLRYSKGHIELSGLTKVLEEAETKRNDLIEKAVTILAPLLVTVADVRRLADKCIKREVAEDWAEEWVRQGKAEKNPPREEAEGNGH